MSTPWRDTVAAWLKSLLIWHHLDAVWSYHCQELELSGWLPWGRSSDRNCHQVPKCESHIPWNVLDYRALNCFSHSQFLSDQFFDIACFWFALGQRRISKYKWYWRSQFHDCAQLHNVPKWLTCAGTPWWWYGNHSQIFCSQSCVAVRDVFFRRPSPLRSPRACKHSAAAWSNESPRSGCWMH